MPRREEKGRPTKDAIDRAIAEAEEEVGPKTSCQTCRLDDVEQINRAILRFKELKNDPDPGLRTNLSWRDFHSKVLVKRMSYHLGYDSMRSHIREHLGVSL
jgi:hypothetical protein